MLKSTTTEIITSLEGFNSRSAVEWFNDRSKKGGGKWANKKYGQLKLTSLKDRKEKNKEKWTELKVLVGHYQTYQYNHKVSMAGKKVGRKNIWKDNEWKLAKFNKRHESIYQRSSINSK